MESDLSEGNITERVIPTETIQLMFHYKNPFIVNPSADRPVLQPRSILSGLTNSYSDVSTNGEAGVVFIQFHPAGACCFFRFPLNLIEDQSIDMTDVSRSETTRVEELLYSEQTLTGKVRIIDNYLLKRFSPIADNEQTLICNSVHYINESKGQITSSELSGKLRVSTKSLERKFSAYLGKTPKQYIKLVRYHEILNNFTRYSHLPLTEHAYLNGYFDQSHFINDFKTYTGFTPREFVLLYQNNMSCLE